MSTERVSKNWQSSGLESFSNQAILGTLNHYGVVLDEEGYRGLAREKYPMAMALEWQGRWKGTGQFARFPFAAASELWRRLEGERLLPTDYAQAVAGLVNAMLRMLDGSADAPVGPSFEKLKELKSKVPLKDGSADEAFVQEVFAHFGEELVRAFDGIAERLAQGGHVDDARDFAELEEFLLPERAGVSKAIVRAVSGEREPAVQDLIALSDDAKRTLPARVSALDALVHLETYEPVKSRLPPILDEAEKAEDHHLALELASRLHHVLKATSAPRAELRAVEERAERLQEAHRIAHPHHHH